MSLISRAAAPPTSRATRNTMLSGVQPNRPEYSAGATRHYAGKIEGILDGQLYGWCCEVRALRPISLELNANDRLVDNFVAERFRSDLLDNGVGNGNHEFFLDLTRYDVSPESMIRIRISRRTWELENSGRQLGHYPIHSAVS